MLLWRLGIIGKDEEGWFCRNVSFALFSLVSLQLHSKNPSFFLPDLIAVFHIYPLDPLELARFTEGSWVVTSVVGF